jgi:hypothetical protein
MLQEKIVTTDNKIHVNEDEILKDDDQNISTANAVSLFIHLATIDSKILALVLLSFKKIVIFLSIFSILFRFVF